MLTNLCLVAFADMMVITSSLPSYYQLCLHAYQSPTNLACNISMITTSLICLQTFSLTLYADMSGITITSQAFAIWISLLWI